MKKITRSNIRAFRRRAAACVGARITARALLVALACALLSGAVAFAQSGTINPGDVGYGSGGNTADFEGLAKYYVNLIAKVMVVIMFGVGLVAVGIMIKNILSEQPWIKQAVAAVLSFGFGAVVWFFYSAGHIQSQ